MIGFRKVRTPLTTFQRVDIELLMRKTIQQIGLPFVRQVEVVTDLDELILDRTNSTTLLETATSEVLSRLPKQQTPCEVQAVATADLGYPSTYTEARPERDAIIRLAEETLDDPLRTVMELAFQFSCHYWHDVPAATDLDKSPRTSDLLPLCCGFGVLGSEACLYDKQWSQAGWAGWSISRSGYYSTVEIGYALALFARCRNETDPEWSSSLRLDSRETAELAAKFFDAQEKLEISLLFDAETIPSSHADMSQLASWLNGGDPAFALAAGYALAKLDGLSTRAIEAAMEATRSGDPDVVPVAARLLGKARSNSPELQSCVIDLIRRSSPRVALAAMQAAVELNLPLGGYRRKVAKLLNYFAGDPSPVLDLIGSQGTAFRSLAPKIMSRLALAIRDQDESLIDAALICLERIHDDTDGLISKYLKPGQSQLTARTHLHALKTRQLI